MYQNIAKQVIDIEISALKILRDGIGRDFELAVKQLFNTKGKIIISGVGKSGHIAKKIASTFSSIGSSSFFIHPTEASHGDLGMITKNDSVILISNSGEASELLNLILHCKKKDIQIIGITSEKDSTLAKKCNILLNIPNNVEACPLELAPTSSTTSSLVLGDALAVSLLKKNSFTREDFGELHPAGKLGKKLLKIESIMKVDSEIPLIMDNKLMSDAIIEMTSKGLGCVGVVSSKKGSLLGMITDGDLRRNMNNKLLNQKVTEVMTKKPKTLGPKKLILDALKKMNSDSITSLFITKNNKPLGIIHLHDILKY